jgi:hypothetical protein
MGVWEVIPKDSHISFWRSCLLGTTILVILEAQGRMSVWDEDLGVFSWGEYTTIIVFCFRTATNDENLKFGD